MLLSILVHTRSLRFGIPAFVLVGVSPHFFSGWLVWRLLSCMFPRRVYERVDEIFYNSYQSLVTFFFETYNGTKLIFYGDDLPVGKKENVIYISNHQAAVDWVITDMIAIRQESLGRIRYVLKSGLRYLPLYGCYFAQHGCLYVRRGGKKNDSSIRRCLCGFVKHETPFWLVIFPEGTRYDISKPNVIKESQDFARSNGLPVMEHILTPRTRATEVQIICFCHSFALFFSHVLLKLVICFSLSCRTIATIAIFLVGCWFDCILIFLFVLIHISSIHHGIPLQLSCAFAFMTYF